MMATHLSIFTGSVSSDDEASALQIVRFYGVVQGPVYQAMYDYEAQDDDEVGFRENDIVVNVEPIDEGWMFGTIERTGMRGMLPANYVERIQ